MRYFLQEEALGQVLQRHEIFEAAQSPCGGEISNDWFPRAYLNQLFQGAVLTDRSSLVSASLIGHPASWELTLAFRGE